MLAHEEDDAPAESWMDLVQDEPPQLLPFGEAAAGSYDLYPCYEHYFHALLENVGIMHRDDHQDHEFARFLTKLEDYVKKHVLQGSSDYASYNKFLEGELQGELKATFQKYCRLYEQPELPVFIKSAKAVVEEPAKQQTTTTQPTEEVTFQRLAEKHGYTPSLNLVLVGQVDHGKSTLLGRLLNEFAGKQANQEQLSAYTDIYDKERERGKTVQFSTCDIRTQKCRLTLFDTPGHRNYMANMILALRLADVVVLVVSAKKGEFQAGMNGGTIGEVLTIARGFGIDRLAVVVSKMATNGWSRKVLASIEDGIKNYLKKHCLQFKEINFVPFDSLTNDNTTTRKFQDTQTLTQWLSALAPVSSDSCNGDLRLPVFDVQQLYGSKHIFGKISAGFLYCSQPITFYPGSFSTTVQTISRGEDKVEFAGSGDFVSFTVKNFDSNIQRGVIATSKSALLLTDTIECELNVLTQLMASGLQCVLHLHDLTKNVEVDVQSVRQGDKLLRKGFLRKSEKGIIRMRVLSGRVALDMTLFDRFVLRDQESTIAYGRVLRIRKCSSHE